MDHVQLGQEVRGLLGKIFRGQVLKEICSLKPSEQLIGLALDMLRKAERIASFGDPHRARSTGPLVDVLEQVMMYRAVVREIEVAGRYGSLARCVLISASKASSSSASRRSSRFLRTVEPS